MAAYNYDSSEVFNQLSCDVPSIITAVKYTETADLPGYGVNLIPEAYRGSQSGRVGVAAAGY